MTNYKLTYFNVRGKAEVIRILFAVAGVDYEDVRLDYASWPGNYKESLELPFGQLPVLSIDGTLYCQSASIGRYLAEKFGLAGKTDLDKLRADMIVHCGEDFQGAMSPIYHDQDEEHKALSIKKFQEVNLPTYCENFEKLLKQNSGGDGYYVGDSLTWADIAIYQIVMSFVLILGIEPSTFIDNYPKLKALCERVEKTPRIAAWIAKRPQTPF